MRIASVLLGLLVSLAASRASAQAVYVSVSGPGSPQVQERIEEAIEGADGLSVTTDQASAVATVEGQISRGRRRRWEAALRVSDAGGGALAADTMRSRRPAALARQVRRWARGPMIEAIRGASAPAPEPEATPEPEARPAPAAASAPEPTAEPEAEDDTGSSRSAPNPLRFELGTALTHRRLTYTDDIFAELRPYELPLWPYIQIGFEYFIGHHTPDLDGLWGLSVYAHGQFAVGLSSRSDNGASFSTTTWGLNVGARYRVFVDEVTLLGDVSYQTFSFGLSSGDELTPPPAIPGVEYHLLRVGGGFRWDIGFGFFFTGGAGYAYPFSAGEILGEDWFPNGGGGSVDANMGFGQRVDDFEFRARFEYRRFYFWFNSDPADARVAGGALDEYFSAVLDVAYTPSF